MSIEIAIAPSPQAIEIEIGGASSGGYLPIASETVLGGIKVGANLKIDAGGVLSVDTATLIDYVDTVILGGVS